MAASDSCSNGELLFIHIDGLDIGHVQPVLGP
jgi:hypothetical protein